LGYTPRLGSLKLGGILFVVYSSDHLPRHIHAFLSEAEVIVDLKTNGDVDLAARKDAIRPQNAKRSDVRKILNAAAAHFEELGRLWESIHGKA